MSSTTTLNPEFNRWEIPVKFGLLTGLVGIILTTVNFMFVLQSNVIAFLAITGLLYLVYMVFYFLTAVRQRAAMGGYISLRDAFSAIFVVILISSLIASVWGVVYAKVIDPDSTVRFKDAMLALMERAPVSEADLEKKARELDDLAANSTKPSMVLLGFAQMLVISSIFGFICALIAKREPKIEMR